MKNKGLDKKKVDNKMIIELQRNVHQCIGKFSEIEENS